MDSFFCPLGLLSDRSGNISGNQPWYSALYAELGGYSKIDIVTIKVELGYSFVFHRYIPEYRIRTIRYPEDFSMDSHDNILAHLYFGSLTADDLEKTGWYINSTLGKDFTWRQCIKDVIRLVKDKGFKPHRNDWWSGDYRAIAKIANKLPRWVQWYGKEIGR